jgi:choline dehydrogenase
MHNDQRFDVIIVGGGTAGCVAASRLSEDPHRRVLLLEAGPDPRPLPDMVSSGRRDLDLLLESEFVLMYPTERKIDGSTSYALAGRIMGGGSSVNAMAAPRPTRLDLDTWAGLGNPGWSYEDCLPVLIRIESDQDFPDSPIHGTDGPLYIKRPWTFDMPAEEPVQAFIDRAVGMGLPLCPDLNGPDPFGVCTSPYNIKNGVRQSTNVAYLEPARERPNLEIVSDALVTGLKVAGARVESVTYAKDGQTHSAAADEFVLTAGVFHSPQILMLSGIGPASDLERLGIKVTHGLDGVGANYQDHPGITMTFEGRTEFDVDWVIPRVRLMYKSDPALSCGNFHITAGAPIQVGGLRLLMPVSARLVQQTNRGRLSLKNTDPSELPDVETGMLEDPRDVQAMRSAMDFIAELTQGASMTPYYGPLLQPGPKEDWTEFARGTYESYHHGSGTCMMGPSSSPMAVVDDQLRVHGLANLRVADASIMPTVTHANTNLTTIMIAERLSDFIKAAS